jgi:SAM-dependent methyltransferase
MTIANPGAIMKRDQNAKRALKPNRLCGDVGVYVCPLCKSALTNADDALRCSRCNRTYPVRGAIPDFILEDLSKSKQAVLRRVKMIDWLAPIYETRLWYPFILSIAGGIGSVSLPQLVSLVKAMAGSATGLMLDVACGPGTFGRRIASSSRRVYGIDISQGMLEQGAVCAMREKVADICFARARAEVLPFGDAIFDLALCCGSLHIFEDTVLALREIGRTLKPGAALIAITFIAGNAGALRFPVIRKRFLRSHGPRIFDAEGLERELDEAGFENYHPTQYGSTLVFSAQKCRHSRAQDVRVARSSSIGTSKTVNMDL